MPSASGCAFQRQYHRPVTWIRRSFSPIRSKATSTFLSRKKRANFSPHSMSKMLSGAKIVQAYGYQLPLRIDAIEVMW